MPVASPDSVRGNSVCSPRRGSNDAGALEFQQSPILAHLARPMDIAAAIPPTIERVQRMASAPQNTAALASGFGIGILWLLMAGTSLWSSARGWLNGRADWGIAWGLVGVLLLAAGIAAMVGTWIHQTRSAEH
jgi:hypothetical protein